MKALDLFCGAGGAAMGLHRAGFEVVGVDIEFQPRYPFTFVQADALAPPFDLSEFDLIWASPPCQAYVQWNNLNRERWGRVPQHDYDLVATTRRLLQDSGKHYILENVVGAPLHHPRMLCGSMFDLGVRRHRLFETSFLVLMDRQCNHGEEHIAVYGKLDGRRIWTRANGSELRAAACLEQASGAMGIDWMEWNELKEAIPPAYSEHLARAFLAHKEDR